MNRDTSFTLVNITCFLAVEFEHGSLADFGFMFESSPGGNIGFEPDFKLSDEMLELMGKSTVEPSFRLFEALTVRAFLAVRCVRIH